MKIILASASPRRRELMKYITEDFEAVSMDCDETLPHDISPMAASEYLAVLKAKVAAEKYPDCTVIGCDTTVICEDEILGKPKDKAQCIQTFGTHTSGSNRLLHYQRRQGQLLFGSD